MTCNSQTTDLQKTAVITGANGGMGVAACLHLHAQGWHILAIDRGHQDLAALQDSPRYKALACDLRAPALIEQTAAALQGMPAPTALINLVGSSVGNSIDQLTDEDWHDSFAVNVTPAMKLTQLVAPLMASAGGGSIVNVGSPVGLIGARKPSYAASKAALQGLTMSTARNLGGDNIRVNLLLPGPTITKMTSDWSQEKQNGIAQSSFLKRLCQAEEVARTLAFMIGPDSSYLTGSIIDLTAGSMYGH